MDTRGSSSALRPRQDAGADGNSGSTRNAAVPRRRDSDHDPELLTSELAKVEELLELLLAGSQDRVTVLDEELTIVRANRVALPDRRRSIIGEKCFEVFCKRRTACDGCPAVEAFERGEPVRVERSCSATCGRTLTIETYPVRGARASRVIQVVRGVGLVWERPQRKRGERRVIIGDSEAMREVFRLVGRVARSSSNVLITGESGTGKELVARAIHEQSRRASSTLLPVNVAAIPRDLIESHLFGHERGSFTGAERPRAGAFRMASQGTVFLDEIGELPLELQAKLLRAIEEKEVFPVGSDAPVSVDVRVIAATHRDLAEMVRRGGFRQDLYYRLDVVAIQLPSLRDRPDDIPTLVRHFLELRAADLGLPPIGVEPAAMRALMEHRWSGNVRELSNVIERATVLGDGVMLRLADLPPELQGSEESALEDLERATATFQRRHIARVLEEAGGHRQAAARLLGISEATLYRKLEACRLKHGRGGCSHG